MEEKGDGVMGEWWENLKPGDELVARSCSSDYMTIVKYKKTTAKGGIRVESAEDKYIEKMLFKPEFRGVYAGRGLSAYKLLPLTDDLKEEIVRRQLVENVYRLLEYHPKTTLSKLPLELLQKMLDALNENKNKG